MSYQNLEEWRPLVYLATPTVVIVGVVFHVWCRSLFTVTVSRFAVTPHQFCSLWTFRLGSSSQPRQGRNPSYPLSPRTITSQSLWLSFVKEDFGTSERYYPLRSGSTLSLVIDLFRLPFWSLSRAPSGLYWFESFTRKIFPFLYHLPSSILRTIGTESSELLKHVRTLLFLSTSMCHPSIKTSLLSSDVVLFSFLNSSY